MTLARPVAALGAAIAALVAAEAAVRAIDGYAIFSLVLRRTRVEQSAATPDRKYLPASVAAGVRPEWYDLEPTAAPLVPLTPDIQARSARYPNDLYETFYMWNAAYLREQLCAGHRFGPLATLDDFYTFEPADGRPVPTYRHIPHINPPGWFTPNNFGWRGPDVTAARPPGTIRIAFVGASTTVDPYGSLYSHPELVGYWLNLWAAAVKLPYRIEVINAARTGVEASSIEAIVRTEVMSVDPDLVVFYEGANNFAPGLMLHLPPSIPPRPQATFRKRSWAEDYFAIAVRVYDALLTTGQDGTEPRKPDLPLTWPPDVDEQNPDLSRPVLPMHFETVVSSLESMRRTLSNAGGELALASFIWMVEPGMRLDLSRDLTLFRYLNDTYWPVTYAQMRRLADFQNRVYRTYARNHQLAYLPMDETFPRDPELFGDAIHMQPRGLRLRAWFYLQQLIPLIQTRIAQHRWPKAPSDRVPPADWATVPPKLLSRASILASCPATVH